MTDTREPTQPRTARRRFRRSEHVSPVKGGGVGTVYPNSPLRARGALLGKPSPTLPPTTMRCQAGRHETCPRCDCNCHHPQQPIPGTGVASTPSAGPYSAETMRGKLNVAGCGPRGRCHSLPRRPEPASDLRERDGVGALYLYAEGVA